MDFVLWYTLPSHMCGECFFVCQNCPDCSSSAEPCQDMFGSNATPEGGILGRVDVIYTSIEAHTSTGSLHAHSQVAVQCLHQHTCLSERLQKLRKQLEDRIQE